jgi:perosamine synthetase
VIRRQPPVYSPVTLAGLWEALRPHVRVQPDPRDGLAELLARAYSADQALLFGTGTQALQVALEVALRRTRGSVVALPAFTCFDVAAAAVGAGARIELYDLDPATLSPDVDSLNRALARGARVAVIAPLYGFPVDWDAVETSLARHGALGVEDAAQGSQAKWRGRVVGSLGSISVLSFGRGKGWSGAAGGALLLRGSAARWGVERRSGGHSGQSAELRVLARLLGQWALGRPGVYGIPAALPWLRLGETVYRDPQPPRAMAWAAAACVAALRGPAEREATARRANGSALVAALESRAPGLLIRPLPGAEPAYLRLPVRLARGLASLGSPPQRARSLGVLPSYPSPLAAVPEVRARLRTACERFAGAEALSRELFTVPTHSLVTEAERQEMLRLLTTAAADGHA